MEKEFTCIICPRGCRLTIDDELNVKGNLCPRGKAYAISEVTNPTRTITSSIRVNNRENLLVSVKTSAPVPKGKIFEVMDAINKLSCSAPTKIGQIIKKDIASISGVDIIITKEID